MLGAVVGVAVGILICAIAPATPRSRSIEGLGEVVIAVSLLMLVIGLLYLLLNAWWIRVALCKPPPAISAIVGEGIQTSPTAPEDVNDRPGGSA